MNALQKRAIRDRWGSVRLNEMVVLDRWSGHYGRASMMGAQRHLRRAGIVLFWRGIAPPFVRLAEWLAKWLEPTKS